MPKFHYFYRNVYGNWLIYPANDTANKLAALIGARTFSQRQMDQIKALGFTMIQVYDPLTGGGMGPAARAQDAA